MTKDEAKQLVYKRIVEVQGCKATELAADINIVDIFQDFRLGDLLDEMVAEGILFEVEYELSTVRQRLKSFLLPGKSDNLLGAKIRYGERESIYI